MMFLSFSLYQIKPTYSRQRAQMRQDAQNIGMQSVTKFETL